MKKLYLIGCGIVILAVILMNIFVFINRENSSNKLVCQSNNGNITIIYDEDTIIGYTAKEYTYDLLSEKNRAEQMGIDKYIKEFSNTYATSTLGTCTK